MPPSTTPLSLSASPRCCPRTLFLPSLPARLAQLPLRLGGLGLRSAVLCAPAAYWASWADCLPVLQQHYPAVSASLVHHFQAAASHTLCLQAANQAAALLESHGWEPPGWPALLSGEGPVQHTTDLFVPFDYTRGWQRSATAVVELAELAATQQAVDRPTQAMLQSQAGPYASRAFTTLPVCPEMTYPSDLFRVLLLRRLRLPLPLSERFCRCRHTLDPFGDHRAACPRSGALRSRAPALERAAARVCREAGARVTTHTLLSDLNLVVDRLDERRLEVVANGLPLWNGAQVAVDTTLVSPLDSQGSPRRHAGQFRGAALRAARRAKERAYPELVRSHRCKLVVLALEVGGRWSAEAAEFLSLLAKTKARAVPASLRQACTSAYLARWSALLASAAMQAFAASLLSLPSTHLCSDGDPPTLSELLAQNPPEPPSVSRR